VVVLYSFPPLGIGELKELVGVQKAQISKLENNFIKLV